MAQRQWQCEFYVNGRRTQQIVTAFSSVDAKKIVEAQFQGTKIQWIVCKPPR